MLNKSNQPPNPIATLTSLKQEKYIQENHINSLYSSLSQMPVPVKNFTGCIEVIEINNWRSFIPSKAVRNYHINNCR